MPLITVTKPFGLRLGSGRERQDFSVGEHFLSDEEFAHWFVQACFKDGRAALVPEEMPKPLAEDTGAEAEPGAEADAAKVAAEEATTPGDEAAADASDGSDETGDKQAAPTREELMALTVLQLKEMAAMCGVTVASNATKAVIVDAVLVKVQGGE